MAYVPGFMCDVFVSFAPIDNAEDALGHHWVGELTRALKLGVTQHLGEHPAFFRLEAEIDNEGMEQHALEAVRSSALFLAVLSPSYLAHMHAKAERRAFAQGPNAAQRILIVQGLPIESDAWPAELRDQKRFLFYQVDQDLDLPTRLHPKQQAKAYFGVLERLAFEIAQRLRTMRSTAEPTMPAPVTELRSEPRDSPSERIPFAAGTFDVFISYPRQDKPTADAACAMLEAAGIRCWIAPRDILPGIDWGEAIIDAIAGAKIMVVIFSRHANGSQQIKREVERAVHKGIPIITVRMEDAPLSRSLEYYLSTPHWLDALTPPLEAHLKRLVAACKALLKSGLSN